MAKRKNPLKDLDAFLKQEAKNFVEPDQVTSKSEKNKVATKRPHDASTEITKQDVIDYLCTLKQKDDQSFYDVLKQSIEKAGLEASENKMLVNTVLYLQNKNNWKETIKEYWS